jgi:hypothetical protein
MDLILRRKRRTEYGFCAVFIYNMAIIAVSNQ